MLEDAVRAHLIADVPVGLFLSSGLDSGAIAALVYFKWYRPKKQNEERRSGKKVEQFPIPFHKPANDNKIARKRKAR